MKAIIMNSGVGRRMRPLTDKNPKCLIQVNGKTILGLEVENLLHYGIKDVIITVGHLHENIKKFMTENFPEVNAAYVRNPRYESTNTVYSTWLVKDLADDDVIYMHGDMVFERELLGKLLKSKNKSCVLVNSKIKETKDFKCRVENNLVKEIGVKVSGENTFFMPPVYKFSKGDFKILMDEIEKFVEQGNNSVYAEDAFNKVSGRIKLHPVFYEDELCMEIDDVNDLSTAREFFSKKNHNLSYNPPI